MAFSGDARAFFRSVRAGGVGRDGDSLRVATLDIGGGTTDLVITTLTAEGQGAHVTIVPRQDFRESFSLAGDDIVLAVIREVILPAFVDRVRPTVGRDRTDMLVQALFGANRGNMDAEERCGGSSSRRRSRPRRRSACSVPTNDTIRWSLRRWRSGRCRACCRTGVHRRRSARRSSGRCGTRAATLNSGCSTYRCRSTGGCGAERAQPHDRRAAGAGGDGAALTTPT